MEPESVQENSGKWSSSDLGMAPSGPRPAPLARPLENPQESTSMGPGLGRRTPAGISPCPRPGAEPGPILTAPEGPNHGTRGHDHPVSVFRKRLTKNRVVVKIRTSRTEELFE